MTSDRTDEQILKDPSGQPSVEQTVGSIGGHDRLNEAPRYMLMVLDLSLRQVNTARAFLQSVGLECAVENYRELRDGQPG